MAETINDVFGLAPDGWRCCLHKGRSSHNPDGFMASAGPGPVGNDGPFIVCTGEADSASEAMVLAVKAAMEKMQG